MELPSIGKQCAVLDCKQLDFLPLQCKCGKIFCSEHFSVHVQSCTTCTQSVNLSENELKKVENLFVCEHLNCKERSIVPLICKNCNKHFCVKHRHLVTCNEKDPGVLAAEKEKYELPLREFNKAKAAVDEQLDIRLMEASKKEKNNGMAAKVQLMRVKNRATGVKTIPAVNRVYFNIHHPKSEKDQSEKTTPVFVSKDWSIGRAIDAIAQELKLKNNNNKAHDKKLRLFKKVDNTIVSQDMSVVIYSLLEENVIVNGENLIIEYVNDNCASLV